MIDNDGRRPGGRAVAILADVGRQNMVRILAGRISAIVATRAVTHDVYMVEVGRRPRDRRVAVIAIVTTRNMA